jgi:uncharacterized protein YaaN involved in tellurite resistance
LAKDIDSLESSLYLFGSLITESVVKKKQKITKNLELSDVSDSWRGKAVVVRLMTMVFSFDDYILPKDVSHSIQTQFT